MAERTETIEKLVVIDEASFNDKIVKDVADPASDTDAVNLRTLNAASQAGGWDELRWDSSNGNLSAYISNVLSFTVNLDGRYLTESEVQALIDAAITGVFALELASGATVQGRLDNSDPNPYGWTLTADNLDLIITHNLSRQVMDAKIWAVTGAEQQLRDTASDNGLIASSSALKILSLSAAAVPIKIYILFV